MEIAKAIKVLQKALRGDEHYRHSWKCNIAMAFQDELLSDTDLLIPEYVHEISNKAADRFLDILIKEVEE